MQTSDHVIDITIEQHVTGSIRAEQVASMFDVNVRDLPPLRWVGTLPLSQRSWQIGLIVGPSGCGKTTIAREAFGLTPEPTWTKRPLVDDFSEDLSIVEIRQALSSVGFSTIPAWLRSYGVLSNGEQFRARIARMILENDHCVIDEFTSVVDRQVAKVASHAIQRYVRGSNKTFVAVSCHDDIVEWLQPDWVLTPVDMAFTWRSVRRRPRIELEVRRAHHSVWRYFAPHHYLTEAHNKAARCFVAMVDERLVAWTSLLHFPHPKVRDLVRGHRTVVLPDWQGLGIGSQLTTTIGAICRSVGLRYRSYPSHPAYVLSRQRSTMWTQKRKLGAYHPATGRAGDAAMQKGRTSAVFEYVGPAAELRMSMRMWSESPRAVPTI